MLFGEYSVVYDRHCLVTAVDARMNLTIEKREDEMVCLTAPDLEIENFCLPFSELGKPQQKKVSFILVSVKRFLEKYGLKSGLDITTKSPELGKMGLGSSSAVVVCTIKGLSELFGIEMTKKEMFDLSYRVVLDVQGLGSGFDLAAAIYGGVLYFFTGGKEIEEIDVKNLPLIVGWTGIKADTPTIVREVKKVMEREPEKIERIFNSIEELVQRARKEIEEKNWPAVGRLMNENQGLLRELNVSSPELENLISASLKAGAFGAKLSGAGGGDCMIAIAPEEKMDSIRSAIEEAGGKAVNVGVPGQGARIEE